MSILNLHASSDVAVLFNKLVRNQTKQACLLLHFIAITAFLLAWMRTDISVARNHNRLLLPSAWCCLLTDVCIFIACLLFSIWCIFWVFFCVCFFSMWTLVSLGFCSSYDYNSHGWLLIGLTHVHHITISSDHTLYCNQIFMHDTVLWPKACVYYSVKDNILHNVECAEALIYYFWIPAPHLNSTSRWALFFFLFILFFPFLIMLHSKTEWLQLGDTILAAKSTAP